jgi:hypothetical protein
MIVDCGFGRGVGVLKMDGKPIPPFELMPQADKSEKIRIRFIQRSSFILHLLLYPSRSQIAPFAGVGSAICDRRHYS